MVPSDKTANFYEISVSEYRNLYINNITKVYKTIKNNFKWNKLRS